MKTFLLALNFFIEERAVFKDFFYFCIRFGELAQLARAFDWQSRGQGFDSPILHIYKSRLYSVLVVKPFFI